MSKTVDAVEVKQPIAWAPIVGVAALMVGLVFLIVAIFILAGIGWALFVAAFPFFGLAAVIFRGLLRG